MASSDELHYLNAHEQAALIARKEISPVDLVQSSLSRIEASDEVLRAWISVEPERALDAARKAEAEIMGGNYRGPLHGLPYGVKDQLHAVGFLTTLGTRVLDEDEMVAPENATIIDKLDAAGAILLGKQNLHEFGKGGTIDFPYGTPRNPWHPAYTASSSSSGSGIAPAAGHCSFSIGEDTGGSVRGPASCNGVVGLRPTFGRVSRAGGVMHAYTADTFGPLARTVRDTASILGAISGVDPRDPLSEDRPVPDYLDGIERGVKGLRLGVVKEIASPDLMDADVSAGFAAALDVLAKAGAEIEEVSLPLAKWAVPLMFLSSDADVGAYFLKNYLRDRYERFDRGTRTRLAASSLIPAGIYNRAMRARVLVRRQILDATERFDALLSPANVTAPKLIDAVAERTSDNKEEMIARHIERRISHYPFSLANVPALAVPMGYSGEGLPLSLQIAAKPFAEAMTFRVGRAYERATEWHTRHPMLEQTLKQAI